MRTKLFLGFGILLLLMFALAGTGLNRMTSIDRSLDEMYDNQYEKLRLAANLRVDVSRLGKNIANLILSESNEDLSKNQLAIFTSSDKVTEMLKRVSSEYNGEVERQIANNIIENGNKYLDLKDEIITQVVNGNQETGRDLRANEGAKLQETLLVSIDNMTSYQEEAMNTALMEAKQTNSETIAYTGLLTLTSLLLGGGVMIWIVVSLTKGLNMVSGMIMNVERSNNHRTHRIQVVSNDEFGELGRIFNKMTMELEETAESERLLSKSNREQALLKTNLVQMTTLLQGFEDLYGLAQTFIGEVCRMTSSSYGAFYILEKQDGKKFLKLYATYARNGSRGLTAAEKIQLGQGLIGQSALDKKTIFLNEVPADYVNISSAFGDIDPLSLLISPVFFEEEVVAVFEISSLKSFTDLKLELSEQLSDSLGILLNNIRGRMKVEELLRISQALTEELQRQSEELMSQKDELKSSYDKLEHQAIELSVASKYKSEFLANMSHELRTPLNSLLILSQLLAHNKEGNLTDKQIEYAETIHTSGQELLKLIDDVLDLSKIESGKLDLQQESVSIQEIAQSILRAFQPLAEQKGLKFAIQVSPDFPEQLMTDRQRLMQILRNLLSNAIKFTNKGEVKINFYRDWRHSSMVTFSVEDTGIGIPVDKQEMIFEAFRQADGTTGRKYGGTGLGLSISREFAQLLGGEIQLESEEGRGSRFTLFLPEEQLGLPSSGLKESAASLQSEVTREYKKILPMRWERSSMENSLDLAGKRLLLVDDDIRNLYSLTNLLESFGMIITHAETGVQAIELLRKNPNLDLIIMDVMMPEMDGYEAMRQIRGLPELAKIPIIALTAKAMREDKEKCIQAGASDYVTKPVQAEQLLSLVQVWLCKK
ncbi:ATP-binding protein [Paenibacillus eucommiae]|nr:ATP-binding protein [Paenibacillus eucommiae]